MTHKKNEADSFFFPKIQNRFGYDGEARYTKSISSCPHMNSGLKVSMPKLINEERLISSQEVGL